MIRNFIDRNAGAGYTRTRAILRGLRGGRDSGRDSDLLPACGDPRDEGQTCTPITFRMAPRTRRADTERRLRLNTLVRPGQRCGPVLFVRIEAPRVVSVQSIAAAAEENYMFVPA
jgi:hypothetical protein